MKRLGLTPGLDGKTVIVQGLGNVGYHAAKFLQEGGAVIVGIAEYEGAIYNPKGLDVDTVFQQRRERGSILKVDGGEKIEETTKLLEYPCDILVPAALENQITMENVHRIQAKIIGEAANGPVTSDANKVLREKGVMIIPDMYLNAGGVTVSYFEWLKNISHVRFGRMGKRFEKRINTEMLRAIEKLTGKTFDQEIFDRIATGADEADLVNSGLEETMVNAYWEIRNIQQRHEDKIDLRTAAFIDAIEKVARSYYELGIFP